MKLTIIPKNKVVILNSAALHALTFSLPNNIHAVQWFGTKGEIEYNDGTLNKPIKDISPYQPIIDIYNIEKEKIKTARIEANKLTWDKIKAVIAQDLALSDYTQLLDAPISKVKQLAWAEYRQELRDVPSVHIGIDLDNYSDVDAFKLAMFPKEPLPCKVHVSESYIYLKRKVALKKVGMGTMVVHVGLK